MKRIASLMCYAVVALAVPIARDMSGCYHVKFNSAGTSWYLEYDSPRVTADPNLCPQSVPHCFDRFCFELPGGAPPPQGQSFMYQVQVGQGQNYLTVNESLGGANKDIPIIDVAQPDAHFILHYADKANQTVNIEYRPAGTAPNATAQFVYYANNQATLAVGNYDSTKDQETFALVAPRLAGVCYHIVTADLKETQGLQQYLFFDHSHGSIPVVSLTGDVTKAHYWCLTLQKDDSYKVNWMNTDFFWQHQSSAFAGTTNKTAATKFYFQNDKQGRSYFKIKSDSMNSYMQVVEAQGSTAPQINWVPVPPQCPGGIICTLNFNLISKPGSNPKHSGSGDSGGGSSSSTGAIVGGIFATIAGLCIVGGVYWYYKRQQVSAEVNLDQTLLASK